MSLIEFVMTKLWQRLHSDIQTGIGKLYFICIGQTLLLPMLVSLLRTSFLLTYVQDLGPSSGCWDILLFKVGGVGLVGGRQQRHKSIRSG